MALVEAWLLSFDFHLAAGLGACSRPADGAQEAKGSAPQGMYCDTKLAQRSPDWVWSWVFPKIEGTPSESGWLGGLAKPLLILLVMVNSWSCLPETSLRNVSRDPL